MIYILSGNDLKSRNAFVRSTSKNKETILISPKEISKQLLNDYASNISLFGDSPVVITENILENGELVFTNEELEELKNSPTIFIFLEDKILAKDEKKYKKFTSIKDFDEKVGKQIPKINIFAIADAFGNRDKIKAWTLYREAIEAGIDPEPISGMLFWKIKTLIISGSKFFEKEELKTFSSRLVSLYHNAHGGECDFVIGLEQFILESLGKK